MCFWCMWNPSFSSSCHALVQKTLAEVFSGTSIINPSFPLPVKSLKNSSVQLKYVFSFKEKKTFYKRLNQIHTPIFQFYENYQKQIFLQWLAMA